MLISGSCINIIKLTSMMAIFIYGPYQYTDSLQFTVIGYLKGKKKKILQLSSTGDNS